MFKLELIDLLNQHKKADKYEKKKIEDSITNLMKQNEDKLEEFNSSVDIDEEQRKLLEKCYNSIESEKFEEKQDSDTDRIRNAYERWLTIYEANQNKVTQENIVIITKIIETYMPEKHQVLEKVLEIEGDSNYEKFKINLKNYIRLFYSNQIKNYLNSEKYLSRNLVSRFVKECKLSYIFSQMMKYKMDHAVIMEEIGG